MSLTGNASNTNELQGSVESGGEVRGKLSGLHTIRGYSAFEIAAINGFSGTEEEWLATLKGEKGDPGKDGVVSFEELTEEQKASLHGEPGYSPTVKATETSTGVSLTIKNYDEEAGEEVTTFVNLKNGEDGDRGLPGVKGDSSSIVATETADGVNLHITNTTYNANGSSTSNSQVVSIKHGSGGGSGDMTKTSYDPNGTVANAGGIAGYVSSVVGDIDSVLDDINGEVV